MRIISGSVSFSGQFGDLFFFSGLRIISICDKLSQHFINVGPNLAR